MAPRLLAVAALAAGGLAACSEESEPQFAELTGWDRVEIWAHQDVVDYDRVAVATGPGGPSWFTRARGNTDVLAYWTSTDAESASQLEVDMPREPVVIPVAVATDTDEGWVAAAVSRDRANGPNVGLLAWQSGTETPRPQRLNPPDDALGLPTRVEAARVGGTNVVTGVAGGRVVAWRSEEPATAEGSGRGGSAAGRWRGDVLDLDLDAELVTADLASDGERLVLAGVDADGGAYLWTSPDGADWQRIGDGALPGSAGSATVLGPVGDGELLVGWLDAPLPPTGDVPRSAPSAVVQRVAGDRVTDEGVIEGRPDAGWTDLSLLGAAPGPDGRAVVVGSAWRSVDEITPMVWVRTGEDGDDGDDGEGGWEATSQPELASRLDYEMRTVVPTPDDGLVGLVTRTPRGIDVEVWRWSPGGSDD